jgi:type IV secretion system protein VirD4
MVSRSETARPLLTPGEVMQLPPADEIVMVAGTPPIRAKKARYLRGRAFQAERLMAAPRLRLPVQRGRPDDWTGRPVGARSCMWLESVRVQEDAANGDCDRVEPELPEHERAL